MGVVGYSDSRFDYSSVPVKEFHPIGKLAKLTFNFVKKDGDFYDFKGINHTLTMVIRYYTPVQKRVFEQSVLNPNYNSNILEYMKTVDDNNDDTTDDSSEEETEIQKKVNIAENEIYKKREGTYQDNPEFIKDLKNKMGIESSDSAETSSSSSEYETDSEDSEDSEEDLEKSENNHNEHHNEHH